MASLRLARVTISNAQRRPRAAKSSRQLAAANVFYLCSELSQRQYGCDFRSSPAVRIRQMEEAVRLIHALWTEKRTTFHGTYFHAEDAILEPKPVQRPHPPILIAGGGEQMTLRAVARLGQGWITR